MSDNARQRNVAQGMARLKELLFDSEAEALSKLEQRLNSIESTNHKQTREHLEMAGRVEQLFDRAGTEERFRSSVATVLDRALSEAELRKHDEMAHALAPLVVNTIKTELKNSQDELVEIMYPITGRMVRAFVASEIKKLAESVNSGIDQNPTMLRVRSLISGRPVSDLAIAESQRLAVTEVFLIRRGSGELLAHWPSNQTLSNADIHVSGMLSAINDIASTAFNDEGGSFRSFEYEGYDVHMRASSMYLVAAKCTGVAPSGTDVILDEAFIATLERISEFEQEAARGASPPTSAARSQTLLPLVDDVEGRTGKVYDDIARSRVGGAIIKLVLFLIAVPLLAWFFWGLYTDAEEWLVQRDASRVIAAQQLGEKYQPRLEVGYRGKSLTVSGLLPNAETERSLVAALKRELGPTEVKSQLVALQAPPPAKIDTSAIERRLSLRIAAAEDKLRLDQMRRALMSAEAQLRESSTLLKDLEGHAAGQIELSDAEAELSRALSLVDQLRVEARRQTVSDALTAEIIKASETTGRSIEALITAYGGGAPGTAATKISAGGQAGALEAAEQLSGAAHRLSALIQSLKQVAILVPVLAPKPPPAVVAAPTTTPEDELVKFAESNAIFFSSGTQYFAEAQTTKILDEVAELIKGTDRIVRLVGYTDERGDDTRNRKLAQDRADTVLADLLRRGVPANRLVAIGRLGDFSLKPGAGADSPNRRVQFELGFRGEARRQQ